VLIGATFMTLSFMGYAFFSPTGVWIYVWIAVGALGGLMMPAMQGIMSSAVPADSQGELQGAIASVMSLTMMTSPLVMTRIFTTYTDAEGIVFPGAPLLLGGVCIVLSMIPFAIIVSKSGRRAPQASPGVSV
jgi:DHA1 family tetracycline resistance protein-like MFS transporter